MCQCAWEKTNDARNWVKKTEDSWKREHKPLLSVCVCVYVCVCNPSQSGPCQMWGIMKNHIKVITRRLLREPQKSNTAASPVVSAWPRCARRRRTEAFLLPFLPLSFTRWAKQRVPTPLHPFIQPVGQGQTCAAEGQESANSVRHTNTWAAGFTQWVVYV